MTHSWMACLRMAFGMYTVIVPWECVPSFVLTIMPSQEKIRSLTTYSSKCYFLYIYFYICQQIKWCYSIVVSMEILLRCLIFLFVIISLDIFFRYLGYILSGLDQHQHSQYLMVNN
jgi:hypothetical protein